MKKIHFFLIATFLCGFANAQTLSDFIVVDQFGYLPEAPKVAVIKNPNQGFDAHLSFTPGGNYALVDAKTGNQVFTGSLVSWKGGATDASSGDQAWWFDFSEVTETGKYYVLDNDRQVRSFEFQISPAVYNEVLKHAVRTFFYQRVGFAKNAPFAEQGWIDGASHVGNLQDKQARVYNSRTDASTEKDLSGGWYDAGDFNKYTNWTADYVIAMMFAYIENPQTWTDDYNIPESGNGNPDLLDEAKWGLDHLIRMQNDDGSVLSIVGLGHASPPSAATAQSLYGLANTSATLTTAAAFALSSPIYRSIGMEEYADELLVKAMKAWDWADANPNVIFRNNDPANGSQGLGAGQQEVDDYGRLTKKIQAACFLFAATGDTKYRDYFDANYTQVNMIEWTFAFPFQTENQDMLLYYTTIKDATGAVKANILSKYNTSMINTADNYPAVLNKTDPYRAHLKDYTWGSNNIKSRQGNMFLNVPRYSDGVLNWQQARQAAIGYVNYIHGVNPLNFVYLSNMFKFGAKKGVTEFYHTWFANGSPLWDKVGVSTYGPAPGFLVGGANPSYQWDSCCPSGCGSAANNDKCNVVDLSPVLNQPRQKSYLDFNDSWPLNSWELTENSCGYQVSYIRLLANFVNPEYDCNGDLGGSANIDICGNCTGGNTGETPASSPADCETIILSNPDIRLNSGYSIYPNPSGGDIQIELEEGKSYLVSITDQCGRSWIRETVNGMFIIPKGSLQSGIYIFTIENNGTIGVDKIIVR